jgi:hypothetical protein
MSGVHFVGALADEFEHGLDVVGVLACPFGGQAVGGESERADQLVC